MTGINLAEFAGVLTAIGALLSGIFLWTQKVHEGRVADLRLALERVEKEGDARADDLREDFQRQLQDVKQAMMAQALTIERQEIMLSDYARHVSKLERIMAGAQLPIPDFEASHLRGGRNG